MLYLQYFSLATGDDNCTTTNTICIKQGFGHIAQNIYRHKHSDIVSW